MRNFFDWIYNHQNVIWPTISPALLAIISLFFKTKKNDEDKLKDRLTLVGITIVVFALIGVIASFQTQFNDSTESERKSANDSTIQANRYNETISSLQKQLAIDSTLLAVEANHYGITMDSLRSQLLSERSALNQIKNVLHPIYPLRVTCIFEIPFKSLSSVAQFQFYSIVARLSRDPNLKNLRDSCNFSFKQKTNNIYEFAGTYNMFSFQLGNSVQAYSNLKDFLLWHSPKNIHFTFKNFNKASNTDFSFYYRNPTTFFGYYPDSNYIILSSEMDISSNAVQTGSDLSSLQECSHDSLLIDFGQIDSSDEIKLREFRIETGDIYHYRYIMYPDKEMKKKPIIFSFPKGMRGDPFSYQYSKLLNGLP